MKIRIKDAAGSNTEPVAEFELRIDPDGDLMLYCNDERVCYLVVGAKAAPEISLCIEATLGEIQREGA